MVLAQDLPTVTILNPIRGNELGHENEDLLPGLKAQWETTHALHANATWIWQYSALENPQLTDYAKKEMTNQEFGLFLEIDRNFARKSGIQYRGRGPWYFSDGLLLISYDTLEREKLIDTAFAKFKSTFGYYPKTVGAWWIGADSLTYMQQKYGITSAMKAADQYKLDVYTIWGAPWGISYISSKENEGIPAANFNDSSRVVITQWAVRDPLLAYGGSDKAGLFSIQDFNRDNLGMPYFDYLLSLYLKSPLDHVLVGLENSHPTAFADDLQYAMILTDIINQQKEGKIRIVLARDFAKDFLAKKITLSPAHAMLTKDYFSEDQAFWYTSSDYRLSIQKRDNNLYLVDLRNYAIKSPESFFFLPNGQGELRVNTPTIIDSASFPEQRKFLGKANGDLKIEEKDGITTLLSGTTKIAVLTDNSVSIFLETGQQSNFSFQENPQYPSLFFILLIVYVVYSFVVILKTKNKKITLLQCILFFVPLFLALPFLNSDIFFFDKKQLFLSYTLVPFVPLSLKIILFQTLPLLLLPIIHVVGLRYKKHTIFLVYLIFLTILYLHLPYFPLDRSTYKTVGLILGAITFTAVVLGIVFALRIKSKRVVLYTTVGVLLFLAGTVSTLLLSRSVEILNPFEMDALQIVYARQRNVLYLNPPVVPIYKAVRPLLFDDDFFAQRFTQTTWKTVERDKKNNLIMPQDTHVLFFVPRYLGSYVYPEEIEKYQLKKIFENQQIAIFEKD